MADPAPAPQPPQPEKEEMLIDAPPKYNKEQMQLLKNIFDAFDVEKTGHCGLNIIPTTLSTLGVKLKVEQMDALIKEVDANGSGEIEFDEYIQLAYRFIEPEDDAKKLTDELRQAFMIFDKTGKGYLEIAEFKAIIKELEPTLPDNELEAIVEEVDADGSGRIEFHEFMAVMVGD